MHLRFKKRVSGIPEEYGVGNNKLLRDFTKGWEQTGQTYTIIVLMSSLYAGSFVINEKKVGVPLFQILL